MFKQVLTAAAVSALCACGGGGGGGSAGGFAPIAAGEPKQEPVLQAPSPVYPNCYQAAPNHVACDLISSEQLIGAAVPAGQFASFTNRTGVPLQIIDIGAYTLERRSWSEYCVYLGSLANLVTWQDSAGKGEVGCATKQIGEDYAPITWGTGLVVAPGEMVMLNAHTEPSPTNHTYTLRVQYLSNGGNVWRQPRVDHVYPCNGGLQHTVMTPWRNDTGHDVQFSGASIYAEAPGSSTPNTVREACVFVLVEGGAQKYANCDLALRSRGEVSFPPVTVAPGEYIAAQANNVCSSPAKHWNYAAFLNVR